MGERRNSPRQHGVLGGETRPLHCGSNATKLSVKIYGRSDGSWKDLVEVEHVREEEE